MASPTLPEVVPLEVPPAEHPGPPRRPGGDEETAAWSAPSTRLGLTSLLSRVYADAPRRDSERVLFTDLHDELRQLRIGAIRMPRPDGTRLRLTEYFDVIGDLAIADSNLAHSLRNHYAAVENSILDPGPSSPRLLDLAAGGWLFGGATQQQTGSKQSEPPENKVVQSGPDEFLVSGHRYYATGSLYSDYLIMPVTLPDGAARTMLIPADRDGIEIPDDWGGFGQRLTGSGSIVLRDVRVTSADEIERPGAAQAHVRYPFTFNQVHLTTVVAGIANRALLDAVSLVRARARNYYHGSTAAVPDEPVIQAVLGQASAQAFAATSTIRAAAARLEESWDAPHDLDLSLAATIAASQAKITVESLALGVIDALAQVASGSTLSTERALDRHWRNVKVLASHNPSVYKLKILGDYELHGTRPPLSVYF